MNHKRIRGGVMGVFDARREELLHSESAYERDVAARMTEEHCFTCNTQVWLSPSSVDKIATVKRDHPDAEVYVVCPMCTLFHVDEQTKWEQIPKGASKKKDA